MNAPNYGGRSLKMPFSQNVKLAISCNIGQFRPFLEAISLKTKHFLYGSFCMRIGLPVSCLKKKRKQRVTVNILQKWRFKVLRCRLISQCGTMFALQYFSGQLRYCCPVFVSRLTIESTTKIAKPYFHFRFNG